MMCFIAYVCFVWLSFARNCIVKPQLVNKKRFVQCPKSQPSQVHDRVLRTKTDHIELEVITE